MEGHGGTVLGAGIVPATVLTAGPALLLPSSRPVGVVFWVAVPVVAVVIDVVARRTDGRMARADEFVRFISTAPAANVALMLAWTFAGYHLFARDHAWSCRGGVIGTRRNASMNFCWPSAKFGTAPGSSTPNSSRWNEPAIPWMSLEPSAYLPSKAPPGGGNEGPTAPMETSPHARQSPGNR